MKDSASRLKRRLKNVGLTDSVIEAAWPTWWSDDADSSPSAQAELRFSVARKLGLDPHSLLEDGDSPRFIWRDEARFKHLSTEGELERSAITSFGTAFAKYLLVATSASPYTAPLNPRELRNIILRKQPFVRLLDILAVCWSLGIPVVHLRVFPLAQKRMAAMAVGADLRSAIMMGKDSDYPAQVAFYLAHELGHIALGHVREGQAVVDLESAGLASPRDDPEENGADTFALELLTGDTSLLVLPKWDGYSAKGLARAAVDSASQLRIEPGTLALCFGYSTGDWATANAAMKSIYEMRKPVWVEINKLALDHLDLNLIPHDARSYLSAALGAPIPE